GRCATAAPNVFSERLGWAPAVSRVVAPPAQPVQLLGEVRELEPHSERPQDERLLARGKRWAGVCDRVAAPVLPGAAADALDELEQPRPLLLDEHCSEERAQQTDVAAE